MIVVAFDGSWPSRKATATPLALYEITFAGPGKGVNSVNCRVAMVVMMVLTLMQPLSKMQQKQLQ